MRFINKSLVANRLIGLDINRRILRNHRIDNRYIGLQFNNVDKSDLTRHITLEQDGLCCYCMRNLHIVTEGNHRQNVTLEHVIPHKISEEEWLRDRREYREFQYLRDNHVTVCYKGLIDDPATEFGMPPFPHFLSYDNLVASCDGETLNEIAEIVPHHCCNNKRGNTYVRPVFFQENIADEISYDNRGHVQCPEEYVPYLGKQGVNIMCPFLNDVRLFWKQIASSEYNVNDIIKAEDDTDLRLNIIDDVFTDDPTGHWLFLGEKNAWCVFSDYTWFYIYYTA